MSTCSNQDTRRSREGCCLQPLGGISISTGSASAPGRYSFPACLTQGWWWPNQDREPSHPHNGLVKSSQFLLQPGEEARQREQRQCAGFFGLLLPYLPFDSLFPRHPTNRWLQFLLPAAERTTRESHMRCSTFVCATHLSPAWPWLKHSRKYFSHNCQEKIYLVSHQLKIAIVKQINRYPM